MKGRAGSIRWIAVGVFGLYTALNYLDRQTLAALAPEIKAEFHLSNEDYGWMQSAFSITYALAAPVAGLFIDRIGLSLGSTVAIGFWSLAAAATGLTTSFGGLLACRIALGAGEGGAIPGFGKANATYLKPEERALGSGLNQLGISLGIMAAPLLAGAIATAYGWRMAFAVGGALGFLWIPLWWFVDHKAGPGFGASVLATSPSPSPGEMLRDPRLWSIVTGNILLMTVYSLWTNWTTIFLVQQFELTQELANQRYAWIPPLVAAAGGMFGGWMSFQMARSGVSILQARSRSILVGAVILLSTAAVPLVRDPGIAVGLVSCSFFWCVAASSNLYALPLDVFGVQRAAFGVAAITSGYGLMQVFYAPFVGWLVDRYGFQPVCWITAVLPLAGWLALRVSLRHSEDRV